MALYGNLSFAVIFFVLAKDYPLVTMNLGGGILTDYDKVLFTKGQLITDSVVKIVTIAKRGFDDVLIEDTIRETIIQSCKDAAIKAKVFKTLIGGM